MTCPTRREHDEMVCARCALRWAIGEEPPPCPELNECDVDWSESPDDIIYDDDEEGED